MIIASLPRPYYNKWIEVDSNALRHNVAQIRAVIPTATRIMGVVKANAYGHNVSLVVPELVAQGITDFGVATIAEGVYIRPFLPPQGQILILGALSRLQYEKAIEEDLAFMVHSVTHIPLIEAMAAGLGKVAQVHLKVDTGMGRVGIHARDYREAVDQLQASPHIQLRGICSHLATSDNPDCPHVRAQLKLFAELRAAYSPQPGETPPLFHIANSDAIFHYPEAHHDMVRPGISLYGYGSHGAALQPVLRLQAQMTQIHDFPAGYSLGYGRTFTTARESVIAVLPLGYADGMSRRLSNQMHVLIHGQRAPIVGRISMDQCLIDLTDLDPTGITLETPVTLIGQDGPEQVSAHDWAACIGTISYEVLTGLGSRIPRFAKA
jgi:alanine racemase